MCLRGRARCDPGWLGLCGGCGLPAILSFVAGLRGAGFLKQIQGGFFDLNGCGLARLFLSGGRGGFG
jgi:hypothetical protein